MKSQLPWLVYKSFHAPGDWETLVKAAGSAGLGMGGRWAGACKLGREERVKCSPSPPRNEDNAVQGASPWPDSSSPWFLS